VLFSKEQQLTEPPPTVQSEDAESVQTEESTRFVQKKGPSIRPPAEPKMRNKAMENVGKLQASKYSPKHEKSYISKSPTFIANEEELGDVVADTALAENLEEVVQKSQSNGQFPFWSTVCLVEFFHAH
jgi:hypothetical protein